MNPWSLDSRWFDLAVVLGIFAAGSIAFGQFEAHKPRWRRLLKMVLTSAILVGLAEIAGRGWLFGLIGVMGLAAIWIHAYWLPKHGVNGWTGEPRDRYLALVKRAK